jgi:hypothetical protein
MASFYGLVDSLDSLSELSDDHPGEAGCSAGGASAGGASMIGSGMDGCSIAGIGGGAAATGFGLGCIFFFGLVFFFAVRFALFFAPFWDFRFLAKQ